jgi:HAD superfamily hydrolase (TIGR01450 family)
VSARPGSRATLASARTDLLDGRSVLISDLDGVVYLDDQPIPHAAEAFAEVRRRGFELRFVTNNAARPPEAVARSLAAVGVVADPSEVITSAMGAAQVLADRLPPGSPVLVVGGEGVRAALSAVGLRPVTRADEGPVAVLQGFAPEVGWAMLAEAMVAIRAGATWLATNLDRTLPSPRGPLPGNGSLVSALTAATGIEPESVGKPARTLYDAALTGGSPERALAVGDRLDTDIEGAVAAGVDSLLVLTGVSGPADLLAAAPAARPGYLGRDLSALFTAHPEVAVAGSRATCAAAIATWSGSAVELAEPRSGPDGLDGLRALCGLAWGTDSPDPQTDPDVYVPALNTLGLD